jgi:hypothetical protein
MPQMKNKLTESLYEGDLQWLVYDELMIDMHKTKLGSDKDYVVLTIAVKDIKPANDLAGFIEQSSAEFDDIEVSPATDSAGRYLIYVELQRNQELFGNIKHVLSDASKLTAIKDWKFITGKMEDGIDFNEESFAANIMSTPEEYELAHPEKSKAEETTESIKNRFKFLLDY